ncbi:unnamed protein product [Oppiella nova]|uniref:EB domain-containing protein n=1 Tax=Oppiella nova TaxID=334625 RepID=A0A7R9MAP9_9ACAR|nr:unnamed protein product [Oppiella nova]CAG2172629.1 unnamed protein product [Oppiella nova]
MNLVRQVSNNNCMTEDANLYLLSGFEPNLHNGEKCMKINPKCDVDSDCYEYPNHRCIHGNCRCEVNYKPNPITSVCEMFTCGADKECKMFYDMDRRCDETSGKCVCDRDWLYENQKNGRKCEPSFSRDTSST